MSENQTIEKKVLALKYRPKRFEDLVGQSTISQTLSLALDSNRLSHAYLFSGLRGSGKTSTARIMAKALLCSNGPTSKPCEICENCKSANTNRHLDIIEMDAASNRGIDDIKDLIEHTKYKPSSARFKVFIIDEVHMLTTQAFNALLKTLEEPPGFVKFILATTDPLKLPATILSRTQHFRFNKIAPNDVLHHLSHILHEEEIDFETPALEILTRSGQGSLRDTLTLLDQAIIYSKGKVTTTAVVDMLGLIEPKLMEELFDIILTKGDVLKIVKELENYEISQVCDEMTIYLKQKMLEKDAKFDLLLFDRFFRILSDAKHLLSMNSDGGFVLILTLMKMVEATNIRSIDDIINQVENVEIKPVVKEAIALDKVIEHSHHDVNHVYDDQDVTINKEYFDNKKEEKPKAIKVEGPKEPESTQEIVEQKHPKVENENIEIKSTESLQTIALDSIEGAVEIVSPVNDQNSSSNSFSTPFDEVLEEDSSYVEEIVTKDEEHKESTEVESTEESEIEEVIYEPIPQVEESKPEEPKKLDANEALYKKLTQKVYERDYDLGELFEKNFIYKSFEDKRLQITTFAKDDERKFLLKHYGIIKVFIYDTFGNDIDIEFVKPEESGKKSDTQSETKKEEPAALDGSIDSSVGNIDEGDVEIGAGCVADMQIVANPAPSQKELDLQDILNSSQINAAKELLRVKKITVKTKT